MNAPAPERPVSPRRPSLVQETAESLVRTIRRADADADGWLAPERVLAQQLGVSRPVLREAVKQLQSQGMLDVRHGVGVRVVDQLHKPIAASVAMLVPELQERLRQLTEVRAIVEPEVARLAAARATPEHLAALREAQHKLKNAATIPEAVEQDLQFHRILALASGNQLLLLILDSIGDLGRESRAITISHFGVTPAYRKHETIRKAVERRDGATAASAMRRHMQITARDIERDEESKGDGG